MSRVRSILLILLFAASCSSKSGPEPEADSAEKSPDLRVQFSKIDQALGEAVLNYDAERFQIASEKLLAITRDFPSSPITAFAELKAADALFSRGDFSEARSGYEEFLRVYPIHEASEWAKIQIAQSYLKEYRGRLRDSSPLESAAKRLKEFLSAYPRGIYRIQAEKLLAECHQQLALNELEVARFYCKQGISESCVSRLLTIARLYPETTAAEDSLSTAEVILVDAPQSKEKVVAAFNERFSGQEDIIRAGLSPNAQGSSEASETAKEQTRSEHPGDLGPESP